MRAIAYDQHGEARHVLRLCEQPAPAAPAAGQVRVRVLSRPVHPGDLAGVQGFPGVPQGRFATPRIPGLEGMGVVETVGEGVRDLRPGQRVAFFPVQGAWGEFVTAPAGLVVPVPEGVGDEIAALMLVNPITLLTFAKSTVQDLTDAFGFAPVDVGSLREGGRLMQLGGPLSALHALKQD